MIKVLHLRSSSNFLGAERVVIELSKKLPKLGFEPVIGIPLETNDEVPELYQQATTEGIEAQLFYCSHPYDLRVVSQIRNFITTSNIQVVHSHGYREDLYAFAAHRSAALVATNHLWKRTDLKLKLYAALDGFLLKRFQHVVAVSQPIVHDLKAAGIKPGKISLIPNGINTDHYAGDSSTTFKEELNLASHTVLAVTVSSLTKEKGIDYAIRAVAATLKRVNNIHLAIVGDGEQKKELQNLVRQLGIENLVTFVGRRGDIDVVLKSADIFLLPSLNEGLPMAMLEAMAAGTAVIATDVGDVASALADDAGIIIDTEDLDALSTNLENLALDSHRRIRLGRRATETVSSRFSSTRMAADYADIYRQAVRSIENRN